MEHKTKVRPTSKVPLSSTRINSTSPVLKATFDQKRSVRACASLYGQQSDAVNSDTRTIQFLRREKREEIQRFAAGEKNRLLWKTLPKSTRLRTIRNAQKRATEERTKFYAEDFPEFQGFGGLAGLGAAAFTTFTTLKNWKCVEHVSKEAVATQQKITSSLDSFIEAVKNAVNGFAAQARKLMDFWWVIPTGILCYLIYREWCSVPIFATVLTGLFAKLVPDAWNVVSHRIDVVEEQSGLGMDIASLVATLVCTVLVPFKSASQLAGEVMKRIASYDRAKEGFKSLFADAIRYAEKAVNALLSLVSERQVDWTDKTERLLEVWMVKVDEFDKLSRLGNPTIKQLQAAIQLQIEGIGFRSVLRTPHASSKCDKYLQILGLAIQPHKASLDEAGAFRATPVFGCFGGQSAVGKTALLKNLATAVLVMSDECTAAEAIVQLFQKGTTPYWNGYVGQKCYILDDAFQEKPVAGMTDSECMQLIRSVGNWKYPLNFADLPSKGNFTFTSPLVLATTNVENVLQLADNVVNCPEAVVRRIQFGYWLTIAPDWLIPMADNPDKKILDYERLERVFDERLLALAPDSTPEEVIATYPWEAWHAHPHKFSEKAQIGSPKPFMDIILEMSRVVRERREQHERSVGGLQRWLDTMQAAKRRDDVVPQDGFDSDEDDLPGEFEDSKESFPISVRSHFAMAPGATERIAALMSSEANKNKYAVGTSGHEIFEAHLREEALRAETLRLVSELRRDEVFETLPSVKPTADEVIGYAEIAEDDESSWLDRVKRGSVVHQSGVGSYQLSGCDSDDANEVNSDILEMRIESRTWLTWIYSVKYWLWKRASDLATWTGRSVRTFARFMRSESSGLYKGLAVVGLCAGLSIVVALGQAVWNGIKACVTVAFGPDTLKTPKRRRKKKPEFDDGDSDSEDGSEVSEQSNVKEDAPKQRNTIKFHRFAEQQVGTPVSSANKKWVYENTYKLVVGDLIHDKPEDLSVIGQIQFVQGQVAIFPNHYIENIKKKCKDDEIINFMHPTHSTWEFRMTVKQFISQRHITMQGVDVAFMSFSLKGLKAHHNIVPYMLAEKQMANLLRVTETKVTLVVAELTCNKKGKPTLSQHEHTSPFLEHVGAVTMPSGVFEGMVRYHATTAKGDCGAPLLIHDHAHYGPACYIGFHVAGRSNSFETSGYATVITKENIMCALNNLGTYRDCFADDLEMQGIQLKAVPQSGLDDSKLIRGSMLAIGQVSKEKGLSMAGKTALKPSLLQQDLVFGESPTAPAILRPVVIDGERVSPMENGLSAYQTALECKDIPNLDAIVEMATMPFIRATRNYNRIIMTPEEAVIGLPSMKLRPVARDTSAGYPYRLETANGKKDFFGVTGEYTFTSDKWKSLEARVLYVVDCAKDKVRLAHVFSDFLKDELRPLHKVESVATRVISGAPLDYVIAVRMYFGAFQSAMFSTRVTNGMSPGINHYSEWGYLAEALLSGGKDKVFGGDFSRFDASEQPYIHVEILNFINRWYKMSADWKPEDDIVREILWLDLIHSRHLTGDGVQLNTIVQWNKSLPSGHPLTTVVNSLYSLITLTACYYAATGDLRDMWQHVFLQTFGDDNVNSVDDTVCEVFNQDTVAGYMADLFGLKYTADDKSDVLTKYGDISAVTFLKRRFVVDRESPSGWVGPLLESSFRYIPYWYRNNKDPKGDLVRNIDQMLGELCLHTPEMWERDYALLLDWTRRNNVVMPWSTRSACRQYVFARTDAWF